MPLVQSVTVGARVIDLYSFQGEVVDEKKWATTHVSGGGGGTNVGSGATNPVTITSTTTTHDQFFLRDENGKEMAVELADAGVAVRKGHRVTMLWGIIQGNAKGPFLFLYNHDTGTITKFEQAINSLAAPPTPLWVVIAWVVAVLMTCLYGIGLLLIVALIFVGRSRRNQRNQLTATLRSAVEVCAAQVKNQK